MHNLPKWELYQKILENNISPEVLGFPKQKHLDGNIARLNARYRLAKSFKGVNLENYSSITIDGYSAIMKAFLVFSTLESYLYILNVDKNDFRVCREALSITEKDRLDDLSKNILLLDEDKTFYGFILEFSDKDWMRSELQKFYNEIDCNPVCLLASVRHIFAHGMLTPHAYGSRPNKVIEICNLLSDFFLRAIEDDFALRLIAYDSKNHMEIRT